MQTLVLVRGLPGSGKSTLAKLIAGVLHAMHLEADSFFIQENGLYEFDASKLKDAHAKCQADAAHWLKNSNNVVVSNTFTTLREMQPYLDMATNKDIVVVVVKMVSQFQSIHDVPAETVERMRLRWQDYPGELSYPIRSML